MTDVTSEPLGGNGLSGLSSQEAKERLARFGPNRVTEPKSNALIVVLRKFWEPVPWMLEVTVGLEFYLRRYPEAAIIAALLLFNTMLSLFQERRAQNALALLRQRLAVKARTLRDGRWHLIDAQELVPGDAVHLRMGDLVPADVRLLDGRVQLDQSALTGESMPVEGAAGDTAWAGAVVRRGEASGEVVATGERTYFGRTAKLVASAKTVSHLQTIIFTIVKYLMAINAVLVATLFAYCLIVGLRLADIIPFALILMVAAVPAALPATFTLATALGALELAGRGVLVARLSAIEEAAAMDVLCSDKTGTITRNRLALAGALPLPGASEAELLFLAALASDEATQDPIDMAILAVASSRAVDLRGARRVDFVPFDPALKLCEATAVVDGRRIRALKGAPQAVAARANADPTWEAETERLAAQGSRVLAVAGGQEGALRVVGLLAFQDPPHEDSPALIASLKKLGVRVVMVTGDGVATARAVAAQVGIGERTCGRMELKQRLATGIADCDVFAEVLPEDKFELVRALQRDRHVVGMTGDGVNDAPALKQAEVGIAVANATDVAKAAASLVLTRAGLGNIVAAVETSRRIYQRMLTYTLNKIIKTVEIALFLSLGVMLTRSLIVTPLLIVLLLFTNDFVTMSIATDHVTHSVSPDRWDIRTMVVTGLVFGTLVLMLSFSLFFFARSVLELPLAPLRTVVFITLVFTGQGTVYLIRERAHFWHSRPSLGMLAASAADIVAVCFFAVRGILMAPLAPVVVAAILLTCACYLALIDLLKVPLLRRLGI